MQERPASLPEPVKQVVMDVAEQIYDKPDNAVNDLSEFVFDGKNYVVLLCDAIVVVNEESAELERIVDLSEKIGHFWGIHQHDDDYILYGELDILRFSADFREKWSFSGRDIFVRSDNKECFWIEEDGIYLGDWLGWYYHLDFDGHLLREWHDDTVSE